MLPAVGPMRLPWASGSKLHEFHDVRIPKGPSIQRVLHQCICIGSPLGLDEAQNLCFVDTWVVRKIRFPFWYPQILGALIESITKRGPYHLGHFFLDGPHPWQAVQRTLRLQ